MDKTKNKMRKKIIYTILSSIFLFVFYVWVSERAVDGYHRRVAFSLGVNAVYALNEIKKNNIADNKLPILTSVLDSYVDVAIYSYIPITNSHDVFFSLFRPDDKLELEKDLKILTNYRKKNPSRILPLLDLEESRATQNLIDTN